MSVVELEDGVWAVVNDKGEVLFSGTQAAAWAWFDRHDEEAIEAENTRRRIGRAFSEE